jgi:hypothetical protein
MAVAAVLLTLCVAAPELASSAGAATPSAAGVSASRPNGTVVLVARRRSSRARNRRARMRAFLKGHPKLLAQHLKAHPALVVRALRKKGIAAKLPARTTAKHRRARGRYARGRRRGARVPASVRRRRRLAAIAAARHHRTKHKKGSSGHSLGMRDYLEIALLVLAPFAAVALLLYITDVRRRPRAPSRSKRRRSLVITPLNKG